MTQGEFVSQKLVIVFNWFSKLLIICFQNWFQTSSKPELVFHLFLLKLKPVHQTIQTTSDSGLVSLGGIQNGDSVTTHTKIHVQFSVENLLQYTWGIYFLKIINFLRDSQQMLRHKDH
jgi:hypothetical protein